MSNTTPSSSADTRPTAPPEHIQDEINRNREAAIARGEPGYRVELIGQPRLIEYRGQQFWSWVTDLPNNRNEGNPNSENQPPIAPQR